MVSPALQFSVKTGIAALAAWFIYKQVIQKESVDDILSEYDYVVGSPDKRIYLLAVVTLMLVNWLLEAMKWKYMMQKLEFISLLTSLRAVFSGLTVSFFTPNRIGEYAGRVFHLRSADRMKATFVTMLENFSQLLVTLVVGSFSLIIYLNQHVTLNQHLLWSFDILLVLFSVLMLLCFFLFPQIDSLIMEIKFFSRLRRYFEVLTTYSKSELLVVFLLALLRYGVFTFQFYLLMHIFDIAVPYPTAILLINMIFYVMTLVPTFALTELGVRGAVAVYFLNEVTYDSLAAINTTLALWLINLVVPAVIGIIFIFQFRFDKRAA